MVDLAKKQGIITCEVVAQIGEGSYVPENLESHDFLKKDDFQSLMDKASAVISHAGIGTISDCLRRQKPMLVMPRRKSHGELVDDHQLNTANIFSKGKHLMCFENLDELQHCVNALPDFTPRKRNPNRKGISDQISAFLSEASL